nr:MAG TPA: hypothetical protein [Caudoviricetes sp.]
MRSSSASVPISEKIRKTRQIDWLIELKEKDAQAEHE